MINEVKRAFGALMDWRECPDDKMVMEDVAEQLAYSLESLILEIAARDPEIAEMYDAYAAGMNERYSEEENDDWLHAR